MATCLSQIERRQSLARRLGIPLATAVRRKIAESPAPFAQVLRGSFAAAAALIALLLIGTFAYSKAFHSNREIGVPVGVPIAESTRIQQSAPTSLPPNLVKTTKPSASSSQPQTAVSPIGSESLSAIPAKPFHSTSPVAIAKNETNKPATSLHPGDRITKPSDAADSNAAEAEREPPAAGPGNERDNNDDEAPVARSRQFDRNQSHIAGPSKSHSVPANREFDRPRTNGHWAHARFLGVTPGGRLLFRLPSGRIVAMTPQHGQSPIAVRPRYYSYPPEPPIYYFPPSHYY
jgi:hypothetical protein